MSIYRKLNLIFSMLVLAGLLLAACQPAPPPAVPPPTENATEVANSVNATLTAVAALATVPPAATSAPPSPTLEPTPLPPTPTATLAPGSGDPAADLGNPDGADTFDSPVNFGPLDTKCFSSQVTGGQFVMAAEGLAGIYCWATSWPTIQDFYIETTVIMPDSCIAGDDFGLLFRSSSSVDGYLFGFTCKGEYSLTKIVGGVPTVLIPPTASDKILAGPGQVNRMGVEAFSGSYYLYANGQYLNSATDFSFTTPGEIGYYVNAASSSPFVSRYDELKIWKLEDAYYPPSAPPPTYPPVEPAPPTTGAPTVTATTYVNVRTGPGTNYPILGAAPTGTTGEVAGISTDGGWYEVKVKTSLDPSGIAWVSADFVTLSNPSNTAIPVVPPEPAPPPVTAPPPASGAPTAMALEAVNVRSGPSTDYPIYGAAQAGATAPVVGKSQDGAWVVVSISTSIAPDGQGWVSAAYVQLSGTTLTDLPVVQPPAMPPEVVPPPPAPGSVTVQTTEPVNVRAGPGNEFPSYGKVPAGTPLQAVGISQDGGWVAIKAPVPNGIGWVSAAYLQPFDPSSLPTM
jgi:uncharacterized protein YraI